MESNEVILEVLAEGGSAVLYGLRSTGGWLFSLDFILSQSAPRDPAIRSDIPTVVGSWPDALPLMDRYQWHLLFPSRVHPEFRAEVLAAVKARCDSPGSSREWATLRYRQQWETLCAAPQSGATSEDLSKYQAESAVHSPDTWLYDQADQMPDSPEDGAKSIS